MNYCSEQGEKNHGKNSNSKNTDTDTKILILILIIHNTRNVEIRIQGERIRKIIILYIIVGVVIVVKVIDEDNCCKR
jgi:hypothetical protein